MIYIQSKLDKYILDILGKGPMLLPKLVEKSIATGVSRQGVYSRIRKLRQKEVIVIHNKNASINSVWLKKTINELEKSLQGYTKEIHVQGDIRGLEDGDSVTYRFKDLNMTDSFWCHALFQILPTITDNDTVYFYNPHEWFLFARESNELELINEIQKTGSRLHIVLAGNTDLDKQTKKLLHGERRECHLLGKYLFKENYYVTFLSDYMIEVWLDASIARDIERFYVETKTLTEDDRKKLVKIVSRKGLNKMIISRSKKKTDKIRKQLSKYFV